MFYNILLFGRYQDTGEALFVGALQGLLIAVFLWHLHLQKETQKNI